MSRTWEFVRKILVMLRLGVWIQSGLLTELSLVGVHLGFG